MASWHTCPSREDDDLVMGPTNKSRWSYACSKAIDEFLAIAYWKEKRVPTVIARLFNTVGPRQTGRYGMVVPNLVVQALTGRDITVFGDGAQSRCFTHVNDTVDALVGIAAHPDANGEVYNVGSDHEITIIELATRIKRMTGSDSRDRIRLLRQGIRRGLRRCAAARSRHQQADPAHWLSSAPVAGRNPGKHHRGPARSVARARVAVAVR